MILGDLTSDYSENHMALIHIFHGQNVVLFVVVVVVVKAGDNL
jgi:hypothetical protein